MNLATFRSVGRMFKYHSFRHNYKYRDLGIKEAYVLGNGPSLKETINKSNIKGQELYVLNDFAKSDEYAKLKPRHYVLADPYYWQKKPEDTVLSNIKENTKWDMFLYIPHLAYKRKWIQNYLSENSYIIVVPYHTNHVEGYGKFQKWAFKNNYGMPILANVLVATLYIALNNGVNYIHLYGADHSWTESIRVNNQNQVCIADTHFNMETTYTPWEKPGGGYFSMAEILDAFACFFKGYEIIRKYADDLNARIINETPASFIDAFERS